ncbi:MAG: FtsX-like permease family protein [Sandaracinaceae bacterium]|nr:FtsX-like permease family protein [Sandaracinaceae bacterium]
MGSIVRIAWRNLGRNVRRTLLALGAIAIAQIAVLLVVGLINGWKVQMLTALTGPFVGHAQIHAVGFREEQAPDLAIDRLQERLAVVRETPGVAQAFPRIYAPALVAREVDGHAAIVVGLDVERESVPGGMLEGLPLEGRPHDRVALVGSALALETGIQVGDELAVVGQGADGSMANDLLTVGGILTTPVELVNRAGIVIALESAQEIFVMPDMASEITVIGSGSIDDAPALSARLAASPALSDLETLPWSELAPEVASFRQISGMYGIVMMCIVFVAAAAGVANTMLMATFERRRELGMMLSVGITPLRLVLMIVLEALILGLLGVLVGSAAGAAIVAYQGFVGIDLASMGAEHSTSISAFGLTFTGSLHPHLFAGDFVPGFVGVVVVSVAASIWPAISTARLEPMEAMRS